MINIEKSKKIKKIISCALVGGTLLGNGIMVYAEPTRLDEALEFHNNFEMQQFKYYEAVATANIDEFDRELVDLYRSGFIVINNKKYDINYLVLTYDENEIYLVYSKERNIDVLSGEENPNGYHKTNNLLFKDSSIFLNIYNSYGISDNNEIIIDDENINNFLNYFNGYDGSVHREVPETFYKYNEGYKHVR